MPDIVTSKTWVDGEKGITAAKMNQIISGAVIQPAFYSAKPSSATLDPTDVLLELKGTGAYAQITGTQLASSVAGQLPLADATQNGMLRQVSGLTTDVVDGTNHCVPIASMPGITQMRLRSFNAISNPTMECDQANGGALAVTSPVNSQRIADRWLWNRVGTHQVTTSADTSGWTVPGTTFRLSSQALKITLTTQEASLAVGDIMAIQQVIEGPRLRELINDVHSLELLVASSVAGLKFSVVLYNTAINSTIVYLCTIPSANTPTLITLPNIPIWPGAGNFVLTPGSQGYGLRIVLAAGTNYQTATLGAWQNVPNALAASTQSNFAASPVNSTFTIAFIQHEPGALCTTPIDLPFDQNYDACLRYFQKTYQYGITAGTVTQNGAPMWYQPNVSTGGGYLWLPFKKTMAKVPTMTSYSPSTGLANALRDNTAVTDVGVTGYVNLGDSGFGGFALNTARAANAQIMAHYTADTGW